jgi:hypothetical protein
MRKSQRKCGLVELIEALIVEHSRACIRAPAPEGITAGDQQLAERIVLTTRGGIDRLRAQRDVVVVTGAAPGVVRPGRGSGRGCFRQFFEASRRETHEPFIR